MKKIIAALMLAFAVSAITAIAEDDKPRPDATPTNKTPDRVPEGTKSPDVKRPDSKKEDVKKEGKREEERR